MLRHLIYKIKSTGPITVAEYMKEVLTNPAKVWVGAPGHQAHSSSAVRCETGGCAQRSPRALSPSGSLPGQKSGLKTFSSVQSLSRVRLFATSWTAARQVSLSIINSWSLLKPMSIELVMPSNHLCRPLLLLPLTLHSIFVCGRGCSLGNYFFSLWSRKDLRSLIKIHSERGINKQLKEQSLLVHRLYLYKIVHLFQEMKRHSRAQGLGMEPRMDGSGPHLH